MIIKIVLLGDMNVGKTTFITKYITGRFNNNKSSTLGASFFTHDIKIDNEEHMLEIWDTAGQERYRSLAPMYYRSADAALLFFDLSNLNSYQSINYWKQELSLTKNPNLIQIIVGNKLDLVDKETINFSLKKHFLISSKENIDVVKLIETAAKEVIKIKNKKIEENKILLSQIKNKSIKKSKCC
jgi:small GTP-binding protein